MRTADQVMNDPILRPRSAWDHIKLSCYFVGLIALSLLYCGGAQAREKLQLIGATNHSEKLLLAGLEMTMDPGWHTYWRHPGDSGIAPTFDWSKSQNVAEIEVLWPAPLRFDQPGDMTIGYKDRIVWPVLVRPTDPAKPVMLRLSMHYGVCSDICIPGRVDLHLTMSDEATSENDHLIRQFLTRVPSEPDDGVEITAYAEKDRLIVSVSKMADDPALIIEGPSGIWFGKPIAKRDGKSIHYAVPFESTNAAKLKGADVALVFSGTHTAIKATRTVK
mgnify:CR=1 FL=1